MALFTNYPIAMASGMGLNAYFAYSVCGELAAEGIDDPWRVALAAVFVEGILFVLLSLCNFRERLINDVPSNLNTPITAGVGSVHHLYRAAERRHHRAERLHPRGTGRFQFSSVCAGYSRHHSDRGTLSI